MPDSHETRHISRGHWVFYGFLAIAGFLLLTEHHAHVLGILPYLFLLACSFLAGSFCWLLHGRCSIWRNVQTGWRLPGLMPRCATPNMTLLYSSCSAFLLQWPTIVTLAMFPNLAWMYVRLARTEERDTEARFGEQWREYAAHTPGFIPQHARAGPQGGAVK